MTIPVPAGFGSARRGRSLLVARDDARDALERAGFGLASVWERELEASDVSGGRGKVAHRTLDGVGGIVLKRMRRGGLVGGVWRERFAGTARLLDNVRVPLEARERGVATPGPVALLAVEGPRGLFRAWIAFEEIAGASDLIARLVAGPALDASDWSAVMRLVRRMHDAGIAHADLHLGNLLLVDGPGSTRPRAFVIDLDRARARSGGLSIGDRRRALLRLERSYVKHANPVDEGLRNRLWELYAAGDAAMAGRLVYGRALGRLGIRLRRRGRSGGAARQAGR